MVYTDHLYEQMMMNVHWVLISVIIMPSALTQMVATPAHVMLVSLVMAGRAVCFVEILLLLIVMNRM